MQPVLHRSGDHRSELSQSCDTSQRIPNAEPDCHSVTDADGSADGNANADRDSHQHAEPHTGLRYLLVLVTVLHADSGCSAYQYRHADTRQDRHADASQDRHADAYICRESRYANS
jgi:hypothetical protein